MQYTINELYKHLYSKANNVYGIFKDFFGEMYVDIQDRRSEISVKNEIKLYISKNVKDINFEDNDFDKEYEIPDTLLADMEEVYNVNKVTIYVWWPSVTITNENDRSIDIQDLYAQIVIQLDGRIPYENYGFLLNRATYTTEQFASDFMHSHVRDIPKHDFTRFQPPCLGTGPIKETVGTLKNDYSESMWMLFCQELSMYVTVESLRGVPYNKLEQVGNSHILRNYEGYNLNSANIVSFNRVFYKEDLKSFIKYYLENGHLTLSYKNGNFVSCMPYYEYIIDISNSFIDFYNLCLASTKDKLSDCFTEGLLHNARLVGDTFYSNKRNCTSGLFDIYCGKKVLTFKGREIKTNIIDNSNESDNSVVTIIDHDVAMYILRNILRTINYRYKNKYYERKREYTCPPEWCKSPSPTHKRVVYI